MTLKKNIDESVADSLHIHKLHNCLCERRVSYREVSDLLLQLAGFDL